MSSQRRQLSETAAERLRVAPNSMAISDSIDSIISNVGDRNDLGDTGMPPCQRHRRSLQRRRQRCPLAAAPPAVADAAR